MVVGAGPGSARISDGSRRDRAVRRHACSAGVRVQRDRDAGSFIGSIPFLDVVVDPTRYGERAVDCADYAIERIPGIESVSQGCRRTGDAMPESNGGNSRAVVPVECPTEREYALAFGTIETPEAVVKPIAADEMRTPFVPMAPNPVTGGRVVSVPERRIVERELTVDGGIRTPVTSGVALKGVTAAVKGVSPADVRDRPPQSRTDSRPGVSADPTGEAGTEPDGAEADGYGSEGSEPDGHDSDEADPDDGDTREPNRPNEAEP